MKILPKPAFKNSSGQAVLLVLLGMAVVLTLVLSVVSRSVTDISITTRDEDSARAFSAAEAGIENLIIGGPWEGSLETGISYNAGVSSYGKSQNFFNLGDIEKYYSGETATVWFVSHDADDNSKLTCGPEDPCFSGNNLKVCWGNQGSTVADLEEQTPAIEVSLYYDSKVGQPASVVGSTKDYSGVRVSRSAFDPNSSRSGASNDFSATSGTCTLDDKTYPFSADLDLTSPDRKLTENCATTQGCLLFARIKFLYNSQTAHELGVEVSGGTLPSQGELLSSLGSSGDASRRIDAINLYKSPLDIFESGVFSAGSGADLIK
jgi:hypothetical protein